MDALQRVLKEWLAFFFENDRYRVTHSQTGPSFNDALVEFSSTKLNWRLVNDRAQIFLDCSPIATTTNRTSKWYSLDILFRLISGKRLESAVLTKQLSEWIESNLLLIEDRFSEDRLAQTVSELKKLEKLRAKELFG